MTTQPKLKRVGNDLQKAWRRVAVKAQSFLRENGATTLANAVSSVAVVGTVLTK